MDEETLVKAARELLRWDQERLARASGVSLASLRRFETGTVVGQDLVDAIFATLEKAGAIFMRGGAFMDAEIMAGVALRPWATPGKRSARRLYKPRTWKAPKS